MIRALCTSDPAALDSATRGVGDAAVVTPLVRLWQTEHDFPVMHFTSRDRSRGLILDGVLIAPGWERVCALLEGTDGLIADPAGVLAGSYNLIQWDARRRTVLVSNDSSGYRSLYCSWHPRSGYLYLASSLAQIRRMLPGTRPDREGFLRQMLLSSCIGSRSLLHGVSRLTPKSSVRVGPNSSALERSKPADDWDGASDDRSLADSVAQLIDVSREVVRDWTRAGPCAVALSGGYDSRFLALLAKGAGRTLGLVNLGNEDWIDRKLATAFAREQRLALHVVEPPGAISLEEYIDVVLRVEHLSDYGSAFWLHAFGSGLLGMACPVLNGFLGGPVSGCDFEWPQRDRSPFRDWVRWWIAKVSASNVPVPVLRSVCQFDISEHLEAVVDELNRCAAAEGAPEYREHVLELEVRQFGFASLDTYNLYRHFCPVLVPFSDERILRTFASMPREHLASQLAYREAVRSLDHTGVRFASTSEHGVTPVTFESGPREVVMRGFARLQPEFREFVRQNEGALAGLFDVSKLEDHLMDNASDPLPIESRLILMNAAVLWSAMNR